MISAFAAKNLILTGYPQQAHLLVRAIFEDGLTGHYIAKRPRDARFWQAKKYDKRRWSGKIPKFQAMADDLGGVWPQRWALYGVLSRMAHPRPLSVSLMSNWSENGIF